MRYVEALRRDGKDVLPQCKDMRRQVSLRKTGDLGLGECQKEGAEDHEGRS